MKHRYLMLFNVLIVKDYEMIDKEFVLENL